MATGQDTSASAQLTPEVSLRQACNKLDRAYAITDLVSAIQDVGGEDACEPGMMKVSLIYANELNKEASDLIGQAISGLRLQQEGRDHE